MFAGTLVCGGLSAMCGCASPKAGTWDDEAIWNPEEGSLAQAAVERHIDTFSPALPNYYSYVAARRDDVTDDAIANWYYGYVRNSGCFWCIIEYVDATDGQGNPLGVWAVPGKTAVVRDVPLLITRHSGYDEYEMGEGGTVLAF